MKSKSFPQAIFGLGLCVFLSLLFNSFSCGEVTYPPHQGADSLAILVLCDLSSSIDSGGVATIAARCSSIVSQMPSGSHVAFFPIEDNARLTALGSFYKQRPRKASQKYEIEELASNFAMDIAKEVKAYYVKTKSEIEAKKSRSCIWSNIKARLSWLQQFSDQYCKKLVIMSDMIEECNSSPIGKLYLQKRAFTERVEKRVKQTASNELKSISNTDIYCIFSSHAYSLTEKGFLPAHEIEEIWTIIFQGMGYTGIPIFASSLDKNFYAPCHGKVSQ